MLSLLSFSNLTTSSQPASPRWVGYSAWHHPCTLSNSSHMLSQMRPLVGKNLRLREEHSDVKKKQKKQKHRQCVFKALVSHKQPSSHFALINCNFPFLRGLNSGSPQLRFSQDKERKTSFNTSLKLQVRADGTTHSTADSIHVSYLRFCLTGKTISSHIFSLKQRGL